MNQEMNHGIQIVMGVLAVLVGLGLVLAQLNAIYLRNKAHPGRGRTLYSFKWYRLGLAIVSLVAGLLIIFKAVGYV
jgi:uncharacterized membrane protein HdeD (DUF308 family)